MKLIQQKTKQDCFVCSFSMISGIPYEKVRRSVKNNCKSWSVSRGRGMWSPDIPKICNRFNIAYTVPKDGDYYNIATMCKGKKAVLIVTWGKGTGHVVAWNGFRFYDPGHDKPETASDFYKRLGPHIKSQYVPAAIETSLLRRISSLIYCCAVTWLQTPILTVEQIERQKNACRTIRKTFNSAIFRILRPFYERQSS